MGRGRRAKGDVRYDDGLTDDQWTKAIDNEEDVEDVIERKRKRKEKRQSKAPGDDSDNEEVRPSVHIALFEGCLDALRQSYTTEADGTRRPRCDLFLSLPDRQLYADYYKLIKNPISLNMIAERVNTNYYAAVEDFRRDVLLMVNNAKKYNVEGSDVYQDAVELQRVFEQALAQGSPQKRRIQLDSDDDDEEEESGSKRLKTE
jgi:ATP-dependent helicase STH1/SNF2